MALLKSGNEAPVSRRLRPERWNCRALLDIDWRIMKIANFMDVPARQLFACGINAVGIREVVYKLFLGSKSDYGGKMDQIGRVGKTRISTLLV